MSREKSSMVRYTKISEELYMSLETLLKRKNITVYELSKSSGVPYTTVADLVKGKSQIDGCSVKTAEALASAINLSLEQFIAECRDILGKDGKPINQDYHDNALPPLVADSIERMKKSWEKIDNHVKCDEWGDDWMELYSNINICETGNLISHETAQYLRKKYLRMEVE